MADNKFLIRSSSHGKYICEPIANIYILFEIKKKPRRAIQTPI